MASDVTTFDVHELRTMPPGHGFIGTLYLFSCVFGFTYGAARRRAFVCCGASRAPGATHAIPDCDPTARTRTPRSSPFVHSALTRERSSPPDGRRRSRIRRAASFPPPPDRVCAYFFLGFCREPTSHASARSDQVHWTTLLQKGVLRNLRMTHLLPRRFLANLFRQCARTREIGRFRAGRRLEPEVDRPGALDFTLGTHGGHGQGTAHPWHDSAKQTY